MKKCYVENVHLASVDEIILNEIENDENILKRRLNKICIQSTTKKKINRRIAYTISY